MKEVAKVASPRRRNSFTRGFCFSCVGNSGFMGSLLCKYILPCVFGKQRVQRDMSLVGESLTLGLISSNFFFFSLSHLDGCPSCPPPPYFAL